MRTLGLFRLAALLSLVVTGSALAKDPDGPPRALDPTAIGTIQVLPPEVSRSLEIARVPTSRPIPLIVGTYWNCAVNAQDFEICRLKLVVCDDDEDPPVCFDVN